MAEKLAIFEYTDYRAFLKDQMNKVGPTGKRASFRALALRAGFKSPNFIKLVIDGDRNLTAESAAKIMSAFKIQGRAKSYFLMLVDYAQERDLNRKIRLYDGIVSIQNAQQVHQLSADELDYYSHWLNICVREMLLIAPSNTPAAQLSEMVRFQASEREVEASVKRLEALGLIRRRADGRWELSHNLVTTGAQVRREAVKQFHRHMIKLAHESIDAVPSEERDLTSVTVGVSLDAFAQIRTRLAEARREILEIVERDQGKKDVYQMNFHLFPLTSINHGK